MLLNYGVYDNRNAIKQCNFQYGAIAERKVCSRAYIFKFFYEPQYFPLFLAILGAVIPHF